MKTWKGICAQDRVIVARNGDRLELKRGHEYDLSNEKDNERLLFSRYWVWIPSDWFVAITPGYGHAPTTEQPK